MVGEISGQYQPQDKAGLKKQVWNSIKVTWALCTIFFQIHI